jgi:hypothetical protein
VLKYSTSYKTAQKLSRFVANQIPLERFTIPLSVGRGPIGFLGVLCSQIFSEFYIFYLKLYLNSFGIDRLSHLQHYFCNTWNFVHRRNCTSSLLVTLGTSQKCTSDSALVIHNNLHIPSFTLSYIHIISYHHLFAITRCLNLFAFHDSITQTASNGLYAWKLS